MRGSLRRRRTPIDSVDCYSLHLQFRLSCITDPLLYTITNAYKYPHPLLPLT